MAYAKMIRRLATSSTVGIALAALGGCDSSTPATGPPAKITPPASPDGDPLKSVTVDNEAENMDKLKKAGVVPK